MHNILSFPRSYGFGPEQTQAMGQAYELVHGYIERAGLNGADGDGLCELVARRILEKAASGNRSKNFGGLRHFASQKLNALSVVKQARANDASQSLRVDGRKPA
ncbi:MAG TPA: hypothetical protein VG475_10580 [Pseudolabrys sp.]|nr:hypothetical protein [Pseudolabrys sp.]